MSNQNEEITDVVYKAKEKTSKRAVSFIWVLPLIILGILSWIAYESYMKKGTNIEVVFKSAEGLKENVTPLEYKGLQLGKVTNIKLHDDLKSVKVNILVKNEVAKYVASESSRFYIKRPTISLTKVSGLSTLISGFKIEISPKFRTKEEFETGKEKYIFEGLDSRPDDELSADGYYITLLANDKESLEVGTPIFYNQYQIGEVVSKEFKAEKAFLNAYIYDKFNYLVNNSSKFVMNSALKVNYGPSGLNVELGSLYSAIVGGITVITPKKDDEKIKREEVHILYSSKDDLKKKKYFHIKFANASGIGEDTPIIYKGITVGKITEISLTPDDISTKAFVYDKYKYLLTDKSEFFIKRANVSIDGVENLGNIVRGDYISLDYKKGEEKEIFIAKDYQDLQKSLDSKIITLYANDLNSITKKSKLYFKNIEIGKVVDFNFSKNYSKVEIKVSLDKEYENLVNDHTLFYDMSSKLIDMKNLDLDINYSGFTPLLNGAIGILSEKRASKLTKNSFKLYEDYKEVRDLKRVYNQGSLFTAYFDNSFSLEEGMAVVYKNKEIGFIKSVSFSENESKAKLFIYKGFKKYINNTSAFYKKSKLDFKASLNGINLNIDNFTSFLEGSIHLESKTDKSYTKRKIYSSYDELKNISNSITIVFDDVEGLHEEFSQLTYKGVKIGKVTKISLNEKQKAVVKAQIYDDYESFAKKGVIYYLKKPIISLQQVSDVGSTVMAVNIGVVTSKAKNIFENSFVGFDELPAIDKTHEGVTFKVNSIHASKADVNAPIYYKFVQIGKIHKKELSHDGSKVIMHCQIENRYAHLVRKNSSFYDISGFNVKFSIFSGSKVESNTFTSILKGGLVLVTPEQFTQKASSSDEFSLIEELPDGWDKLTPQIK
ncbi:MlaD family protein [Arcobacter sp. YIC-464]|uniref:MlaD family protein n=1 Tax=Arcobacter sp. YIC-464 TaxID=3376631 RepID=UPI003C1A7DC4